MFKHWNYIELCETIYNREKELETKQGKEDQKEETASASIDIPQKMAD